MAERKATSGGHLKADIFRNLWASNETRPGESEVQQSDPCHVTYTKTTF